MNNHARKYPRHHVRSRHLVGTRRSAGCSPWTRANLHRHPRVKPLSWPRLWMCVCWSTQPAQPGASATRCSLARNMIEFVPKHAPEHRYCRVPCRGCSGSKKEKRCGMLSGGKADMSETQEKTQRSKPDAVIVVIYYKFFAENSVNCQLCK